MQALWRSRSIVWSLTVRDLRSTYSQEILGFAWALLAPVTLMVVFTFFFHHAVGKGKIDTGGAPYEIFSYIGLLPWTFFSSSVSSAGTSLIANPLLNKVYAPREVFPIAQVATSAVSAGCASLALIALFGINTFAPSATSYWVPLLLLILLCFTVGVSMFISAITVYVRDMRHALPLMLQLGLFLTPVIYGLDTIPKDYRALYVGVNPLGAVIDGIRSSVLLGHAPNGLYTAIAAGVSVLWLVGAFLVFKRLETGFADVS
jgi:ABC-2 type transport system permease protein/lipopolysaccharide transport system permease protein